MVIVTCRSAILDTTISVKLPVQKLPEEDADSADLTYLSSRLASYLWLLHGRVKTTSTFFLLLLHHLQVLSRSILPRSLLVHILEERAAVTSSSSRDLGIVSTMRDLSSMVNSPDAGPQLSVPNTAGPILLYGLANAA